MKITIEINEKSRMGKTAKEALKTLLGLNDDTPQALSVVKEPRKRGRKTDFKRDSQILKQYKQGLTFEAIGQRHNITRQRVQQIVKRWAS